MTAIRGILGDDGPMGRSLAWIILVAAWVMTWQPQVDPDVWWHLLVGEHVLTMGDVPRTETWSWINAGQPFVAHSWLWDTLAYGLHGALGLTGTSLLALPVTGAIVAAMWALLGMTAPRLAPIPRATIVALALATALPILAPRSQLVDLVAVLVCLLIWSRYLRSGATRIVWLLPLVTIAWANLHGSGILAFVASLVALAVAVPVGERWGTWPRRPRTPLVATAGLALVAFAVNPYGPALLLYPFDSVVASAFQPAIDEWRSPDFRELGLQGLRVVLAGGILVALALRGRRRDPLLLLSAAGWMLLALAAVRFTLLAGPLTVLALAPAFGAAVRAWTGFPPPLPPSAAAATRTPPPPWLPRTVAAVVTIVILAIGVIQIAPARQQATVDARYPVAATAALAQMTCDGRLLNAYDWGGYLAWAQGRQIGAYGNSPNDVVVTQAGLESITTDPRAFLDGQDVDVAMVKTGGPLDRWLTEAADWTDVSIDPLATIHVRATAAGCAS